MKRIPLKMRLLGAETEISEMSALFDMQRKRMVEATAEWQRATGETYYPDLGQLLAWLLDNRKAMVGLHDAVACHGSSGDAFNSAMCTAKRMKGKTS